MGILHKPILFFIFSVTSALLFTYSVQKKNMTLLALGDSYTIGEGVSYENSWPELLAKELDNRGAKAIIRVIARTGWTTDELLTAIEKEEPKGTFDVVFLLIGVNNQYRGRSSEEYRKEFKMLLDKSIAFAGNKPAHVVVISIPDWAYTPYAENRDKKAISAEIDHFNKINKEQTLTAQAKYVDITQISREAGEDSSLITTDGLHPSGKMYEEWVKKIVPEVISAK